MGHLPAHSEQKVYPLLTLLTALQTHMGMWGRVTAFLAEVTEFGEEQVQDVFVMLQDRHVLDTP